MHDAQVDKPAGQRPQPPLFANANQGNGSAASQPIIPSDESHTSTPRSDSTEECADLEAANGGYHLLQDDDSTLTSRSESNQALISIQSPRTNVALSSRAEWLAVTLVSMLASLLQSTFIRNAEEHENKQHQYEHLVWIGLAIVFIGYGIVNIGFSQNVVRRLKCESKKLDLNSDIHTSQHKLYNTLKELLPNTKGFTRKYPLSYPLRSIFIAAEFILATFAVILNVASFYAFLVQKNMSIIEKNLLVIAGTVISLPYVGLNLYITEDLTDFLMALISRSENSSEENQHGLLGQLRWLYSQLPDRKEIGLLLLTSIIDGLHAVQALGYDEIFSEEKYPAWFEALMKENILIATVTFIFLYTTKFGKTKSLIYGAFKFQNSTVHKEDPWRDKWGLLHFISIFFGLCMSAKAFVPSYSTFNSYLSSSNNSPSAAEKVIRLTAVIILTIGSGTAPFAFYSMNFFDTIKKYFFPAASTSSKASQQAVTHEQANILLGRLYDFTMLKGSLSRPITEKLKMFLKRQEFKTHTPEQDPSLLLRLVSYLYQLMQLKGASENLSVDPTLTQKLGQLQIIENGSSPLNDFQLLTQDLRNKENYENNYLCILSVMFCSVFSIVSSYGYSALLINSTPGPSSLKNSVVAFLSLNLYVLSHERITFRLDELRQYIFRDTTQSDRPRVLFIYASLDPKFVHAVSAITTLIATINVLAGLTAFATTSSWCHEKSTREFTLILSSILSSIAAPYLCLHMDLHLTNGPTKHARDSLMYLSRQRVSKMLCSRSTHNGVPRNFSGWSMIYFAIEWISTVCLAGTVLEAGKNKVLAMSTIIPYSILFFHSLTGRVIDSGEMFRAFFLSASRSPTNGSAERPFRPISLNRNCYSPPSLGVSSFNSLTNNTSFQLLQPRPTSNTANIAYTRGITCTRVLSDLLSAWFKSMFFIRYFYPSPSLSCPYILISSIMLALTTVVGLSVIPSKGRVFINNLSMMDLQKSPLAKKPGTSVNSYLSQPSLDQIEEHQNGLTAVSPLTMDN